MSHRLCLQSLELLQHLPSVGGADRVLGEIGEYEAELVYGQAVGAGNQCVLKPAELPGQERCRFTGRQTAARLQQIEDSADSQLPNGPGILRPGSTRTLFTSSDQASKTTG